MWWLFTFSIQISIHCGDGATNCYYLLHRGGHVTAGACLFVSKITWKVLNRLSWQFQKNADNGPWRKKIAKCWWCSFQMPEGLWTMIIQRWKPRGLYITILLESVILCGKWPVRWRSSRAFLVRLRIRRKTFIYLYLYIYTETFVGLEKKLETKQCCTCISLLQRCQLGGKHQLKCWIQMS